MKIPIKHSVDSGAWLKCETEGWLSNIIIFKVRILSFERVDVALIDNADKLSLDEGNLWLMKIEVINIDKEETDPGLINSRLLLIDQDGFKFKALYNQTLNLSKFGEQTGIKRFTGWSDVSKLKPKIKAVGAVPFLLPGDDEAEYFLSVEGENIQEI